MASSLVDLPLPPRYLLNEEDQDNQTQECKDLLPSLPRHRGWVSSHVFIYQFQGFWYTSRLLQGTLACQKHFQAHNTDILLLTNPKSGTTWLKAMVFAIVNRIQYPHNGNRPLLEHNPHDLVPFLEADQYKDNKFPDLSGLTPPRLFATHLQYISLPESIKESKCKIVYRCTNPKDIFVSFWHFMNNSRFTEPIPLEEAFEKFCIGVSLYGPFWYHVLRYWKGSIENPESILILKYEMIKKEPQNQLKLLAEYLGYPFSANEEKDGVVDEIAKMCSFEKLSNLEVNKTGNSKFGTERNAFFRRGEVGDWKNHLTPEMIQQMDIRLLKKSYMSLVLNFRYFHDSLSYCLCTWSCIFVCPSYVWYLSKLYVIDIGTDYLLYFSKK